jgi:L-amino acid N-acyltransferase YncA
VDGSESTYRATDYALALAKKLGSTAYFVRVIYLAAYPSYKEEVSGYIAEESSFEARRKEILSNCMQKAKSKHVKAESCLKVGVSLLQSTPFLQPEDSYFRRLCQSMNRNVDSTEIHVRAAIAEDAGQIAEIYNQGIEGRAATFETELRTADAMREWLIDHQSKHQPVLVAVEKTAVVGWVSVSTYRPRACYSGIGEFSVYVRKDYRGRGIGEKLLSSLIDEARRLGYWKLLSRIFTFNIASLELCKKCGFREVGIYQKHGKLEGKWLDTMIVERLIPENLN